MICSPSSCGQTEQRLGTDTSSVNLNMGCLWWRSLVTGQVCSGVHQRLELRRDGDTQVLTTRENRTVFGRIIPHLRRFPRIRYNFRKPPSIFNSIEINDSVSVWSVTVDLQIEFLPEQNICLLPAKYLFIIYSCCSCHRNIEQCFTIWTLSVSMGEVGTLRQEVRIMNKRRN